MRPHRLLLFLLLARPLSAQAPDTTRRAPAATINGVVRDSIAGTPLAGAIVQLVPADNAARSARTAIADSLGRFTLRDLPDGRYMLGFFHPMLDSLGVEPPLRQLSVEGPRTVRADLGIPSPARLRAAICGPPPTADSGAVVVGVVRDARTGSPAAGVTVTGEWVELSFTPTGLVRRVPRLVATTGENGWFAICNVPSTGTMELIATRGADSTDHVELQIPAGGFLRRELSLGAARTIVTGDTARRADTLAPPVRRLRVGDGRLSGTVVAAAGERPLAGAQVGIVNGPQTRTNERGEWTLADAPDGTRMLEVRAVTYYPERRPVNVTADAAPIRVVLSTLKAVLDTVKITATRYNRDRNGFQLRRRTGLGTFLTPEDVTRRQPIATSDLFRMMPGVRLGSDSGGLGRELAMRGMGDEWCSPAIYLDGHYLGNVVPDDIDVLVRPSEVAGIEVYRSGSVPGEYQRMDGCGSILIWTR